MKIKNIIKTAHIFYKIADIIEKKYIDWVQQDIQDLLEKQEVNKDQRLINFEEEAPKEFINFVIESDLVEKWESDLLKQAYDNLVNIKKQIEIYFDKYGYSKEKQQLLDLISIHLKLTVSENLYALRTNKIILGNQIVKYISSYNKICNLYLKIAKKIKEKNESIYVEDKIKRFDQFEDFKQLSKKISTHDKKYYIVFTTDYKNMIGGASRSEWGSCQSLGDTFNYEYGYRIIGTCLSKYIGMIYLTDKSDWKNRGERIFYRCNVWIVKDTLNNKDVLLLQKMYPGEISVIKEYFIKCLEKHLNMKVYTKEDVLNNPDDRFVKYTEQQLQTNRDQVYIEPYDDAGLNSIPENENRQIIIQKIKQNEHSLSSADTFWPEYKDLAFEMAAKNTNNILLIPKTWQYLPELLLFMIKNHFNEIVKFLSKHREYIEFVDKNINEYEKLILELIKYNLGFILLVDKNWAGYRKTIIDIIKNNPQGILYADPSWEEYKELVIAALKKDPYLLYHEKIRRLPYYKELVDMINEMEEGY